MQDLLRIEMKPHYYLEVFAEIVQQQLNQPDWLMLLLLQETYSHFYF